MSNIGSVPLAGALWLPVLWSIAVPWWWSLRGGRVGEGEDRRTRLHFAAGAGLLLASAALAGFAFGGRGGGVCCACLLGFGVALCGIGSFVQRVSGSRIVSQAVPCLLGLALCLTPLWTDPLLRASDDWPRGQRVVVDLAVNANPVMAIANGVDGIDLLRQPRTYQVSQLGFLWYRYLPWAWFPIGASFVGMAVGGAAFLSRRRKA
ncbi:MAG: hypothetical protein HYY93_14545 [Planctomycetes bacterium]|nr:hypothetical protein [Planctomycetota bacterium]